MPVRLHPSFSRIFSFRTTVLIFFHVLSLDWGKAHRILIPAFNAKSIRAYFVDMVSQSQCLMTKLSTFSPTDEVDFGLVFSYNIPTSDL
jgi:hypothetical protein